VRPGEIILINDGLVKLEVKEIEGNSVFCKVLDGGVISSKKGLNLPGTKLSVPSVTEKDLRDLEFALKHRVDYVALSFVRQARDIHMLRSWLIERGHKQKIVAKIEKPEAVENFDEILEASDGIMVARGDLGVEMQTEQVPVIQKAIIEKCNKAGKLVITATQMLESMVTNAIPTRAEASDVANAVSDGTDAVMLSAETSVGKHPVLVVETMNNIIKTTEKNIPPKRYADYEIPARLESKVFDSAAQSVAEIADKLNTKAIVAFTYSGRTAEKISKYRPVTPILAFSNIYETLGRLNLKWGVEPYHIEKFSEKDEGIQYVIKTLKEKEVVSEGDLLLFTAVAPVSEKERRTWLHFVVV
jgi:pyruvate kinase